MKKNILFIFIFLSLLGCSNSQSKNNIKKLEQVKKESSEYLAPYNLTLSLEESIKIARERNLDLKVKNLEQEIATLNKKIAFGNFLPSINLMGGYTQLNDEINLSINDSIPLNPLPISLPISLSPKAIDKSFYTTSVGAQIPVFVPSTWYLYSAMKKGEDISALARDLSDKVLQLQVMGKYFYILALESEQNALLSDLKTAKELERKVDISLKVEAVLPWELEKVQTLVKSKELALKQNERDLEIAKMDFLRTLNLDPFADIQLEKVDIATVELPTLENCLYSALSKNEMLQISEIASNISDDAKKIAFTNFLPKVILGGGYINNSNEILADPDFLYGNVTGILSIFNGFKNVNEYKKAVRNAKIADLKLEKEFMTVLIETTKAYKNVEKAKDLLEIANLNYQAEKGKLKQKENERKVNLIGEEEYFEALTTYESASSLKEKATFQYRIALGTLYIAMGQNPFEEGNK